MKTIKLIVSIMICQLAGLIGSFFTTPAIDGWYASINRPTIAPPNWVFAPVWTTLFLLMGISLYLILEKKNIKKAVILFFIQLGFNILWSILFFGLKNPLLAFFEILILSFFIVLTIQESFKISKLAGWLLIPYILWVSFAVVLNLSFVLVNL